MSEPRPALRLVPPVPAKLEELLLANLDRLYSLARHWCRSAEDAEDLVQETALKAVRSSAQLRESARGNAWLYRILLNCFNDRQRKHRERGTVPLDEACSESAARVSSVESRMMLVDAFRKLPRDFAVVVWLIDIEGRSYAEIAAALGISEGTVASRLVRGRARLRAALSEKRVAP